MPPIGNSSEVTVPQIHQTNIIDGGVVDRRCQAEIYHLRTTQNATIKAGDIDALGIGSGY